MRKIAIYGKGGIGKSTTAANLSAALAEKRKKVIQIGCDPKSDSTCNLVHGKQLPSILNVVKEKKNKICFEDIIFKGYLGIFCAECGGPTPGVGCAGRGIIAAFEILEDLKVFEQEQPDVILYDVLGDVVCGGFAMPLRKGYAKEVYIVTSGEKMSLFAARNIAKAIEQFKSRKYARLMGIIQNSKGVPNESDLVGQLAEELGTEITITIPRDPIVQHCEEMSQTVIEGAPDSSLAGTYRTLAEKILSR